MDFTSLSRLEKASVLETLMLIASADNQISYSENEFLNLILAYMHEDKSLVIYAHSLSPRDVMHTISRFSNSVKNDLAYLWLKTASKSCGLFGMLCIDDFPKEKSTIVKLAKGCNVNIEDYLHNKVDIDSF